MTRKEISIVIGDGASVSGLLHLPKSARRLFAFAHGSGAGMRHPFMERMSELLAAEGIATLRYNFLYMERGLKRPDPKPRLHATVRAAINAANEYDLPLLAGGKSMGGRMTSELLADEKLEEVRGIVFLGFPLHPPGEQSTSRADHLTNLKLPMLFLQGAKDKLADLTLLKPIVRKLGKRAILHVFDQADHSFHVPKSSGRADADVMKALARTIRRWNEAL